MLDAEQLSTRMAKFKYPPPRVFTEKRLQPIENKGNEGEKERKETTKRLQAGANKRVGVLERSKEGKKRNTEGTECGNTEVAEGTPPWRREVCASY
jgi:hypothetical protein